MHEAIGTREENEQENSRFDKFEVKIFRKSNKN